MLGGYLFACSSPLELIVPSNQPLGAPIVTGWGYRQAAGTDECFCPRLSSVERRANTSLKGLPCCLVPQAFMHLPIEH